VPVVLPDGLYETGDGNTIMKILVTGAAGFIGFHLAQRLLARGDDVMGLDNINEYYDVGLKHGRLLETGIAPASLQYGKTVASSKHPRYHFTKCDLDDREAMHALFRNEGFDAVCNLAAQAGVRYSLTNPYAYVDSNINGFINILEGCRNLGVKNLSYASSSSVYGLNEVQPFSTVHNVDHPVSLYAASKKANELMAHTYSHLFDIPSTGLRFFTVYGPWGRPDMALFIFTRAILEGRPIDVFNHGNMQRDFTYIDDIIEGVVRVIDRPAQPSPGWNGSSPDPGSSRAPYRIYNIGNGKPVRLLDFIEAIEDALGKKAQKNMLPMQPGDVPSTWADTSGLEKDFGYRPLTEVREGIRRFVEWYRYFYG
jgi:UDP-glucuronate 4-epimerase